MITDQIGQHKVLLPVNHNYDMTFRAFLNKNTRNSFFAGSEKKYKYVMGRTVQLLKHDTYCPITLSN